MKPTFVNVYDFEGAARDRLTDLAYAYYAGGAGDEITLRENRAAYDRIRLRDRKSTRLNSSHIQKSRMPSSA